VTRLKVDVRANLAGALNFAVNIDRAFEDERNVDVGIRLVGLAGAGTEEIEAFQSWSGTEIPVET
jgi:hypothetical protein